MYNGIAEYINVPKTKPPNPCNVACENMCQWCAENTLKPNKNHKISPTQAKYSIVHVMTEMFDFKNSLTLFMLNIIDNKINLSIVFMWIYFILFFIKNVFFFGGFCDIITARESEGKIP